MMRLTSYLAACPVLTKAGSSENMPAASADAMIHSVVTSLKKKHLSAVTRADVGLISNSFFFLKIMSCSALLPAIHEIANLR